MDDISKIKALVSLREECNDLRIVADAGLGRRGFTLLGILRNEMYFLPTFLNHYRRLGVERFVFLNDRSTDGSYEFLVRQADTVVVESGHTYGDTFDIPYSLSRKIKRPRILYLWRAMLHDMFASGDWAVQVDLDEFVHLPDGLTFQHIVERLEQLEAHAAWGVMLDVYPQDVAAYLVHQISSRLDLGAPWYFDGEQHVRLRRRRAPRLIYAGARARLYTAYEIDGFNSTRELASWKNSLGILSRRLFKSKPKSANALQKPVLAKWGPDCYYANSHQTNLFASDQVLLPILHFRFAGNLESKIESGLRERSYHAGSLDHRRLSALLEKMSKENGSFLYKNSLPVGSFSDFIDTGNAIGF
ncbi:MAG: glycosyltransferase family 2 protein [Rhodospirillaceae bacterium]|nr:glycosyltransferase family 2 protein [Rhodospirillaceae bacterium]